MISLPAAVRVYLYTLPCDMRRGFDGLQALASHVIGVDPLGGHLFVFGGATG
jgi:transposase